MRERARRVSRDWRKGASLAHDARGNLTNDGMGRGFGYDAENRLTSVSGVQTASLSYDPAGRLYRIAASAATRFLYDPGSGSGAGGGQAIAEYNDAGALLRRYVPGPGADETLVWYEGSGTGDRRWLLTDARGSVAALADAAGTVTAVNKYDSYGAPAAGNVGRFQFTGQMWLGEVGVYHYKARAYHPALGRFMQPDPIGYADGPNLYAYAGNDPVNRTDPTGLAGEGDEIIVTGRRSDGGIASGGGHKRTAIGGTPLSSRIRPEFDSTAVDEVIVTAQRRGDSYLDGLISTGFSPCIGGCLPIIDFYFDENGLTIVARRADGDVPVYGFRRAPGAINLEMRRLCSLVISGAVAAASAVVSFHIAPLAGAVTGAVVGFTVGQALSPRANDIGAGVLGGIAGGVAGLGVGFANLPGRYTVASAAFVTAFLFTEAATQEFCN